MPRVRKNGWKSGDIRIWTKPLADIPIGWQLCDGTNGTPNMLDRAVVGAGGKYSQNQAFGSDSITPSVSVSNHTLSTTRIPSHRHSLSDMKAENPRDASSGNAKVWQQTSGTKNSDYTGSSGAHNHGASASAVDTRQISIAVYWIMKL